MSNTFYLHYPPTGFPIPITSLYDFNRLALTYLTQARETHEIHTIEFETLAYATALIELQGEAADACVPIPTQVEELLVLCSFNPSFFTIAPEDYSAENKQSPAAIVYENVYRYVRELYEDAEQAYLESKHAPPPPRDAVITSRTGHSPQSDV